MSTELRRLPPRGTRLVLVSEVLSKRWPTAARYEIQLYGGRKHMYRFDGEVWQPLPDTAENRAEMEVQRTIERALEPLSEDRRRFVVESLISTPKTALEMLWDEMWFAARYLGSVRPVWEIAIHRRDIARMALKATPGARVRVARVSGTMAEQGWAFARRLSDEQAAREADAYARRHRDGERYVEAIRGARTVRNETWANHWWHMPSQEQEQRPSVFLDWPPVNDNERLGGIPVGWITR